MHGSDKSGQRLPVVGLAFTLMNAYMIGSRHRMAWFGEIRMASPRTNKAASMWLTRSTSQACVASRSSFMTRMAAFKRVWGGISRRGSRLERASRAEGEFLYHCDINRCKIVKTTLDGKTVWSHGYPREDSAYAERPIDFVPTNVAFAPNGDFYVGDGYGSHHVSRFSQSGKFLGEIGRPGHGDGEFDTPHGLWVDPRGKEPVLLVADRGNRRIQAFTLSGAHIRTIKDEAHLRMPCHFHIQGEWMVCPDLDSQVCILDREYQVIAQLGDGQAANGEVGSRRKQSRREFTPGQFITPHAAIFLRDGNILVAEWLPIGRITLLRRV